MPSRFLSIFSTDMLLSFILLCKMLTMHHAAVFSVSLVDAFLLQALWQLEESREEGRRVVGGFDKEHLNSLWPHKPLPVHSEIRNRSSSAQKERCRENPWPSSHTCSSWACSGRFMGVAVLFISVLQEGEHISQIWPRMGWGPWEHWTITAVENVGGHVGNWAQSGLTPGGAALQLKCRRK